MTSTDTLAAPPRVGFKALAIKPWTIALLVPPVLFLFLFFLLPFLLVVVSSLSVAEGGWTVQRYVKLFVDSFFWDTLLRTLRIGLFATLATIVLGYPLAYLLVRVVRRRGLKRLIYVAVIAPMFTSNIVRSFGWIIILGRQGVVNNALVGSGLLERPISILYSETSMVIGLAYVMLPFMVLTVASVMQGVDKSYEDAAQDLGASRFTAFLKILLPLSLPGVIAGSLIVFTLSVSAYVTPSVLSGGKHFVMSMLIFQQYDTVLDYAAGATLAVTLLVATLMIVTGYVALVERKSGGTGAA